MNTVANVDECMKKLALQLGSWKFSPGLLSSLVTLLLMPLFVYLGFWQMTRYQEKLNHQQALITRTHAPIIQDIPASNTELNPLLRYRQLKVTGHFLNEHQIYLDNQIVQGQAGYRVITPFKLIGEPKLLLVDRGWIPLGKSRNELPIVKTMLQQQTLIGTINLPVNGLQFHNWFSRAAEKTTTQNAWPFRTQRIEFLNLELLLSQKLYPFILQLNPQDPLGFSIQPITFNPPPSRHLGYAIQWFIMAGAVLLYYLVINVSKKENNAGEKSK